MTARLPTPEDIRVQRCQGLRGFDHDEATTEGDAGTQGDGHDQDGVPRLVRSARPDDPAGPRGRRAPAPADSRRRADPPGQGVGQTGPHVLATADQLGPTPAVGPCPLDARLRGPPLCPLLAACPVLNILTGKNDCRCSGVRDFQGAVDSHRSLPYRSAAPVVRARIPTLNKRRACSPTSCSPASSDEHSRRV